MDNNQNKKNIPGTFTTMKDDMSNAKLSPEDRLQQAGSFMIDEPSAESVKATEFDSKQKSFQAAPQTKKDASATQEPSGSLSGFSFDDDDDVASVPEKSSESAKVSHQPSSGLDFSQLDDIDSPLLAPQSSPSAPKQDVSLDNIFESKESSLEGFGGLASGSGLTDFSLEDKPEPKKKKKSKAPVIVGGMLMLLIIVGVSVYALDTQINIFGPDSTQDPVEDLDLSEGVEDPIVPGEETPIEEPIEEPVIEDGTPLIALDTVVPVTLVEGGNIRTDILNTISDETEELIEVTLLTSDGSPVPFSEVQSEMSIDTPQVLSDAVIDYWLYAYNQEGIYKIGAILELEKSVSTDQLVVDWLPDIPADMSGFSLSSSSRSFSETSSMQSSEVTAPSGKVLASYFYNYTEPSNSIDITYIDEYVLLGSSQLTMEALISSLDL